VLNIGRDLFPPGLPRIILALAGFVVLLTVAIAVFQ
jgi:hypothetical protein